MKKQVEKEAAIRQQKKTITGTVVDITGMSIIGANIIEAGAGPINGTITDINGRFILDVEIDAVIRVSYIGYMTQDIPTVGEITFNIVLQEDTESLEEVVVVGYGTQKKVSVVGAISTVNMTEVRRAPVPSLSQALVGKIPGLVSRQVSGEPGQDQAYLYVRGLTNWSDNTPIVIVDGVERDLNSLNMPEIESITFLKDATATAVYGIRGANGVIIITTQKGKVGTPVVTLRSELAQLQGMRFPDFISAGEMAELWNEARSNDGLLPTYRPEEILRYYDGSDPLNYPNINWINEIFEKNTLQTINNLSVSGGTEKVRYFVNLGYTMQDGLFNRDSSFEYNTNVRMHRYNLRSNVDIHLSPSLIAEIGLGVISKQQIHPGYYTYEIMNAAYDYSPYKIPMYNPDGTFGALIFNGWTNPYMQTTHGGYTTELSNNTQGTFSLKWDLSSLITPGLSWTNTFSFDQNIWGWNRRLKGVTSKQYLGLNGNGEEIYHVWWEKTPETFFKNSGNVRALRLFSQLNYSRSFDKHNVNTMLMFNMGERIDLLAENGTDALPSRLMGTSGRMVYDYDTRYIMEFSFGYNGSENFAKGHRFGFFPGVAIGWNVARENFWKLKPVSTLKFSLSSGKVGNDRMGSSRFAYLSTTGDGDGYSFGQAMSYRAGFMEGRIGSENITWEEATKYNAGIDLGLFKERLTLRVDMFREDRDGLLVQRQTVPNATGFRSDQIPYANIGKTQNKGIESVLEIKNTTSKGLYYSVRGNFFFARNICVFADEPVNQPDYQSMRGHSLDLTKGLVALGFFENQEDIDNSPRQDFGPVRPGDVKYRDVNGDGVINNNDRVYLGYPKVPEISYGFGSTIAYKGFDVSLYFTGVARSSYFFHDVTVYPFIWGNEANVQREFYEYRWRPGADNSNAKYPAVSSVPSTNNNRISSLYMHDGKYLRLKNAEIGYTLPKNWLEKIQISNFRLFVNGMDLFLWDNLKIVDPEFDNGNMKQYPKQRTINGGIEVTF
jgi:TonB-linked SusC/RagA family outer membrane protein